jgi:hypothetical protein
MFGTTGEMGGRFGQNHRFAHEMAEPVLLNEVVHLGWLSDSRLVRKAA